MTIRSMAFSLCALAVQLTASAQVVFLPSNHFSGDLASDQFGRSVSGAGDVNNDGFDDFIVGAYLDDTGNGENSGSVRVFSGATGQVLYTFIGDATDDQFGRSISGAGDVNNDGFADVIVGAWQDDNNMLRDSGSARVLSGATGQILYTFNGDSIDDQFGWSVSGAGDVNNDGYDDLIVGANLDDNNGASSGSARVFSGASGAILYTWSGDSSPDQLGWSVSDAGDVNNDGFDDVIVGARFDGNNGNNSGSVRVFSGANGSVLYLFNGNSTDDQFGYSVSGAGDVNNDGFDDLVVGAPFDNINGAPAAGSVSVFSGADGATLFSVNSQIDSYEFGFSVSGAGDINGDGFDDIVVGVHKDDFNGTDSGSVRVFSGASGTVLATLGDYCEGDQFGFSVSGAGDVNNDGYPDLIAGAPFDDNNGTSSGSARVFFGNLGWPVLAQPAPSCIGDADGSGRVDFDDLTTVLANFGVTCP